jgi:signal transduction histidine kinase
MLPAIRRTPLNAILGYTELMADGAYGEPSEKTLGVFRRLEANQVVYNMLNPSAAVALPANYPAQDYGRLFDHTGAAGVGASSASACSQAARCPDRPIGIRSRVRRLHRRAARLIRKP